MSNIIKGHQTVENDRDLVVFLIGARINKWWLLPIALPILAKMRAMQKELLADPESGLLAVKNTGFLSVQYWRSAEHLLRYAEAKNKEHKPAAKRFYQRLFKPEAAGVWHETYVVPKGHYECLYINMPRFLLGTVAPLIPATGEKGNARQRLSSAALALDRGEESGRFSDPLFSV